MVSVRYDCHIKASIPILQCLNVTVISRSVEHWADIHRTLHNGYGPNSRKAHGRILGPWIRKGWKSLM
jgi:hypothetical protein